MKELSILIVSWNGRRFLKDCLLSISESAGPLVREVIVVDNGSTDGSPEMVAAEFPEVELIRLHENVGFARANNLAMQEATGRWLALVNSDVVVHGGCIEALVAFLEAHPSVGLVGPKIFGKDERLQRTCRRLPTAWNTLCRALALDTAFPRCPLFSGREMRHWNQEDQAEVEVINGCFWVARRSAVEQVGGLDERFFFYAEDVDWCKRFQDANWKVVFVPEATATHFGGGSSAQAPLRYSVELIRANVFYWRKHHGFSGMLFFYLISTVHYGFRVALRTLKRLLIGTSADAQTYEYQRDVACIRWLLSAKGFNVFREGIAVKPDLS
jgi:GT2 family glycosyltransferase